MLFDRIGPHEILIAGFVQLFKPCILIRREHRKRSALAGQHFVFFKDHVILERVRCAALLLKLQGHAFIARDGGRFEIVIEKNRVHAESFGQRGNRFVAARMLRDQRAAVLPERRVQLAHAVMDEVHTPVLARQRVQNLAVENEGAVHAPTALQRFVKRRIVGKSQVAAKPHQAAIQLSHRAFPYEAVQVNAMTARPCAAACIRSIHALLQAKMVRKAHRCCG
jgi:hypothetical protein